MRRNIWAGLIVAGLILTTATAGASNIVVCFSDRNLDAGLRVQNLNEDGDSTGLSESAALLAYYDLYALKQPPSPLERDGVKSGQRPAPRFLPARRETHCHDCSSLAKKES